MKRMIPLRTPPASREPAGFDRDALAADILAFLAADDERLGRFFALTGLDAAGLREAAATRTLTGATLAYLAEDDVLLVAFARHATLDPATVGRWLQAETASREGDLS